MRLKHSDIKTYRDTVLKAQGNECPLCENKIGNPHLDHSHETGHVRQVLCSNCNLLEGLVLHKFNRSGLKFTADYIQWLKNLVLYMEQDYSDNPEHPQHKTDENKKFKRLSKTQQEALLREHGIKPKGTKTDLIKQYRKR